MNNFHGITQTIKQALASAGLDTQSGPMKGVTDTIEQALSAAGLMRRSDQTNQAGVTIEGTAHEVDAYDDQAIAVEDHRPERHEPEWVPPSPRDGEFLQCSFTSTAGVRAYKVYVPARYATAPEPVPMVVMLHGCTQSPDDFAAGTRMNALADEHGFIVLYPAQCPTANGQKCWNWFRTQDQLRDSGEPAIIAGMTREVASRYRVDPRRVFVAGMSAGAAMAVILGATYPDLFAAVGAHSGLPYRAAHDMPSAFGAMHGGVASPADAHSMATIPTIVFHGDADRTVVPTNGTKIVLRAAGARPGEAARPEASAGMAKGGRNFSRTEYKDASGRIVAEQWIVHGAGHAWSGGSTAGSFTDARGPDASKEMIRFFFSLPRPGTA